MSFANVIGQLLQQGMAGQTQTRGRLQQAAGQPGGGLDQMLGALLGGGGQGARGPAGAAGGGAGGLGDLAGLAQQFLGGQQMGGMSGAQVGGLGALVGAVLGGGGGAAKGAVGGGAMAILGTLALTALKNYQAGAAASAAAPSGGLGAAPPPGLPPVAPEEVQAVTDPATEKLIVRAMISAAKADGQVDQKEMQRIVGQIDVDGVSDAERQFVIDEMTRPVDIDGLAAEAKSPAVAAEIYAASILAIDIDTEAERHYLRQLAQRLRLDAGTVQRLHQLTGAPAV
jgi:uncharacterized membrane protein YebE (DUF533 family)